MPIRSAVPEGIESRGPALVKVASLGCCERRKTPLPGQVSSRSLKNSENPLPTLPRMRGRVGRGPARRLRDTGKTPINVPFRDREVPVSNALVPLAKVDQAVAVRATSRANADFVAHLIATSAQAPQTRARRRANSEDAIAAYDALGYWPTPAGRKLSRSL